MPTLTAANSVFMLTVLSLFPVPVQLQGFSTDDMWDTDPVDNAETFMGVDGYLSAGWVAVPRVQTINIQADSPSNDFFDGWAGAQDTAQELFVANGIIRLPAISKSYALVRGFLTQYKPMPQLQKTLRPRPYRITWNSITPAPI